MNSLSPFKVIAFLCIGFWIASANAQDCSNPQLLCGQSGAEQLTTADGSPVAVPAGFCFDPAPNAVFYSFETLDLNQFPSLSFDDSTATLSIASIICDSDTLLGQGVNIAIFSAMDPCDPATYNAPISCESDLTNTDDIQLENLLPSTTYYVMVSGVFGAPPATDPSECSVSLSISGPAVTYDLDGKWYPENDKNRSPKILYQGETVVLTGNSALSGLSWTGKNLNKTTGNSVTANPEGIGTAPYTVETTINDCIFSEVVQVIIRQAIRPDNVFTPNGDLYNDNWYIGNITSWQNAQINVYSRWGAKVFQATNYQNNWDGDDLPAATYYYVIELNPVDGNTKPITGSVTILR